MTTYFELPLWIDFDDILNRAAYFKDDLNQFDNDMQDSILQWVHDELFLSSDSSVNIKFKNNTFGGSPGSSMFSANSWDTAKLTTIVRQLQINAGAWAAAFTIDNPAGTGSLSGVSIDAFSVSNTMAKNNATAKDLANANQYGTQMQMLLNQRFNSRFMVGI
ncbi:hypothetical protein KAR91_05075 [Candidatus Pacearchaeota archaeon]|nr:hypothetical protein [Candidatus Pacearchaeota archaeon]